MLLTTLLLLLPQTATPPDSTFRVDAALHRMQAADQRKTRYIRYKLEHNLNFDEHDHKTADTTKLFEDTWINDLPYSRLLEVNGKPLTGDALAAEQARYDKAVADRRALDMKERARLTGGRVFNLGLDLGAVLSAAYRITLQHADSCPDGSGQTRPCHVYLADPVATEADGHPLRPFVCELWVTDGPDAFLTRLTYALRGDAQEIHAGSNAVQEYQVFDDTPVLSHTHVVGYVKAGKHFVRVETDNVFSRYRRFTTSVTVLPGPGNTSDPQTPQE